jgi:hypothetical protein
MSERASVAVACPTSSERASVIEWLSNAGYLPVALPDLLSLDRVLQGQPVEALVADLGAAPREDHVRDLMRRLGANRPLVVLGDASRLSSALRGDLSVIARPLTREALVIGVGLALAECRPVRRYPRKAVEPIRATAHGMSVIVREASVGGVGLDLVGQRPNPLPPYFKLRIPEFGVHVIVKRAWVASSGSAEAVRCGGTVEGDLPDAARPWTDFAREAPPPVTFVARRWAIPR